MIGPIKLYLSDFHIKWILILSFVLNAALFLFLLIFVRQSNVPIVLHYNVDWGVDYIDEVRNILLLPAIGFLIFLFNGILAARLWSRNPVLSYFLTVAILPVQVFLWLAGAALYIINA